MTPFKFDLAVNGYCWMLRIKASKTLDNFMVFLFHMARSVYIDNSELANANILEDPLAEAKTMTI